MNRQGWLSVVIAAVSLAISVATWWWQTGKPFAARLVLGDVIWRLETLEGGTDRIPSLIASIVFGNDGAKPGCVADVVLVVQSESRGTRWIFLPAFYVRAREYIKGLPASGSLIEAAEGTFAPVWLAGHSDVIRVIAFLPADPSGAEIDAEDMYYIEVHGLVCGGQNQRRYDRKAFRLEAAQAKVLARGMAVRVVSEEVKRARPR